jgi:hypothetical protein
MSASNEKYGRANELFRENLRALGSAQKDPAAWNLNTGLGLLAQAIQQDMEELRKRLAELSSDVAMLKRR